MATRLKADFGWFPHEMDFTTGAIAVETLPDLDTKVSDVRESEGVDRDWIYPPPREQHVMGHGVRQLPYASRIFGLPKTHSLAHAAADGPEHLEFLVWALSFFTGMRLTTTDAGFVDATPLKPRKMVDFVLSPREYVPALALAEAFWQAHKAVPVRALRWCAAVHNLFIAHYPHALQFEEFIYLCGALDACFALTAELHKPPLRLGHARRLGWMCDLFGMETPEWADASSGPATVATLRNATFHEGLFMGAPLGFALHGVGTNQNLTLEMEALVCRLLVALIGDAGSEYVRSPVNTRQMHGWSP